MNNKTYDNILFKNNGREFLMKLFNFKIYTLGEDKLVEDILNSKEKIHIISGNAEVFKYALNDDALFKKFLDSRNIIIPDGISVSIPLSKKYKTSIDRIRGIDLMEKLLEEYDKSHSTIYLLGAKQEVLNKLILNINLNYPNINIVGTHHGYIDIHNCNDILNSIIESNANTLFVAMGAPLQETFIFKYMDMLPCKLYMGVGGSFDVLSGYVDRAPKIIQKIGLEWLYRLIKDPSKINRIYNNAYFTVKGLLTK